MNEMNEEQLKKNYPFDQYGRYAIIKAIININRDEGRNFRILDIGGRGNIMQQFLPDDDVFYLDPNVETDDSNYIDGDGSDIPVDDAGFDYVVSADVFEHVEPSKRDTFIDENLRVAKLAVILAAPFASKEVELAERFANESYKVLSGGEEHLWLKEHIDHGLPESEEVEKILERKKYRYQIIPNNSLFLWENIIFSSFIGNESPENFETFNQFYNEKLFPYDNDEKSYRKIFFIKKDDSLKDFEYEKNGIDTALHLEAIKNNNILLSHIFAQERKNIEQLGDEVEKASSRIAAINENLEQKTNELDIKTRELEDRERELNTIHSSVSWKLTIPFRLAWKSMVTIKNEGVREFIQKTSRYLKQ